MPEDRKPGFYRVADTLYLCVKPSGSRSWVQRIVIDGRRHNIGLGSFVLVSISKAKDKAFKNRVAVADGKNPLQEKKRSHVPTFEIATRETYAGLLPTFKTEKYGRDWISQFERYVFPKIGKMQVDKITGRDVLSIIKKLWTTQPATGKTIRQRIRTVLNFCQAQEYVSNNVAGEAIDGALPKNGNGTKNHRAMPYRNCQTL